MPDPATELLQGACSPYCDSADFDDTELCLAASGESGGVTPAQLNALRAAATDIVWVLLGRPNIGVCEATIYPCSTVSHWRWWSPANYLGNAGGCSDCGEHGAIRLDAPVVDVTEVIVDAEVLDPGDYYLLDGIWLVRTTGRWPAGGVGDAFADFSIAFSFGEPISQLVRDAAIEVVVDLHSSRPGVGGDFLPTGTKSVSRQGMSFSVESEVDRMKRVGMALPAVSKAVAIYNPYREAHQPQAWSPDEPYRNRSIRTF